MKFNLRHPLETPHVLVSWLACAKLSTNSITKVSVKEVSVTLEATPCQTSSCVRHPGNNFRQCLQRTSIGALSNNSPPLQTLSFKKMPVPHHIGQDIAPPTHPRIDGFCSATTTKAVTMKILLPSRTPSSVCSSSWLT